MDERSFTLVSLTHRQVYKDQMRITKNKQKNEIFETSEAKKNRVVFEGKSDKTLKYVQKKSG